MAQTTTTKLAKQRSGPGIKKKARTPMKVSCEVAKRGLAEVRSKERRGEQQPL